MVDVTILIRKDENTDVSIRKALGISDNLPASVYANRFRWLDPYGAKAPSKSVFSRTLLANLNTLSL